jgi:hypothetical protein
MSDKVVLHSSASLPGEGAVKLATFKNGGEKWIVELHSPLPLCGLRVPYNDARPVKKKDTILLSGLAKMTICGSKYDHEEKDEDVEKFKKEQFERNSTKCTYCHTETHAIENPLVVVEKPANILHQVHYKCFDPLVSQQLCKVMVSSLDPKQSFPNCRLVKTGGDTRVEITKSFGVAVKAEAKEEAKGYFCQEGDKIDYGRVLNLEKALKDCTHVEEAFRTLQFSCTNGKLANFSCIFCLGSKPCQDPSDPLISICKCKSYYIHYSCMKRFIECRFNPPKREGTKYVEFSDDGKCTICKADLSSYFGVLYAPAKPRYLLVSSESSDPTDPRPLRVSVLDFKAAPYYTVGRGSVISDLLFEKFQSISQDHAQFVYEEGQYQIRDNSRYGTVIILKEPYEMAPGKEEHFQIGNLLIRIRSFSPY